MRSSMNLHDPSVHSAMAMDGHSAADDGYRENQNDEE